ncbi:MAG: ABC-type transport auxiliary lipoprotein family protein [Geminicoccaceae bacterium]
MTRIPLTTVASVLLGLALTACTALTGEPPAPDVYGLEPPTSFADDLPKASWQLVVDEPRASPGLATDRIAVRRQPLHLQYYAGARWASTTPQMLQSLIITSLRNTGRIAAVGSSSADLRPDYRLVTRLVAFEAVYPGGGTTPSADVRLDATLVGQPREEAVAARRFEATAKAKSAAVPDVVAAYNQALDQVLRDLAEWALRAPEQETS